MRILLLTCFTFILGVAFGAPELDVLFGSHAVLQCDQPISIWGRGATAKKLLTITLLSREGGQSKEICHVGTRANWNGDFRAVLPACPAGGPYELSVECEDGSMTKSTDVWLGEVWLASGQSNMQFTLAEADPFLPAGDYPRLRMFTVGRETSTSPQACVSGGKWLVGTETALPGFSAVAAFFAHELQTRLGVTVGIINASWGGTRIEAWTSREALLRDPLIKKNLVEPYEKSLMDPNVFENIEIAIDPEGHAPLDPGVDPKTESWRTTKGFDAKEWTKASMPTTFKATFGRAFNGAVWYRKTIQLPTSFQGKDLEVHLGAIDKHDKTYVEGEWIGGLGSGRETDYWNVARVYTVPAKLTKADQITIAVRVWSQIHAGAMGDPDDERAMYLIVKGDQGSGEKISLTGEWFARIERDIGFVFERPKAQIVPGSPDVPASLYNGMIAPLLGYTIRGAIWYQGESNDSQDRFCDHYGELVDLMVRDWRQRWGVGDFPFIQVELASFRAKSDFNDSGFVRVRAGQLAATRTLPLCGMASALDVGSARDIHPKDKQTVGQRLARWAFANVYGLEKVGSGPRILSSEVKDGAVRVKLSDCGSGLVVRHATDGIVRPCMIAGADGVFKLAEGRIEGKDTVVISSKDVPAPVRAAYAWSNNPADLNLYNQEGLPASPFMTDLVK